MDIKLEIIKLVEQYDCLYNTQSPQNKNVAYKEFLWSEIGEKVGISGTSAKREFKTVRDNYKKWHNKRLNVSGFNGQYKYAEYLGFLDDHMTFRSVPKAASAFIQDVETNSEVYTDLVDLRQMRRDLRLKLIEIVKQYDCLYNIYSPQFNDIDYKQQLWHQFEEEFTPLSAEQIRNMWESLLDDYIQYLQNPQEYYKYAKYLSFLDEYIIPESAISNETFIISFIDDVDDNDDDDERNVCSSNNSDDLLEELTTDINIKIIQAVKKHDCLYNLNSFKKKNFEYRTKLWNQIGKEVGLTGDVAKTKWRSMKDHYRRCKLNNGAKYKYGEYLKFLDDYISIRSKPIDESNALIDEEIVTELSSDEDLLETDVDLHEKIIEVVKRYDCLYDAQSPQYKNFEYKQDLWNEIGNEVGMSVKTVQKKWQYIKDYYINCKQNRLETYKYSKSLKFLDDCIDSQSYEEIGTDLHLQIIEEVKNYKCLYDTESVLYKDYKYRQQVWYKIGNKLGIPPQDVKGKWKHVKDYYRRCKEGSNSNYKYAENLKFLDNYIAMQSKGIDESILLANEQRETDISGGVDVIQVNTDYSVNLIKAVKKYNFLYNEQSPKYKDIKYRQRVWSKIAKMVGKSKKHVNKKWNNILYRYKKCKERMLDQGDSAKLYKYMNYLHFLDDYVTIQRDVTGVNTDVLNDNDTHYIPPVKKKKGNFEDLPLEKPTKNDNVISHGMKEMENFLDEPVSTSSLSDIENSKRNSNRCFEKFNLENSFEEKQASSENLISVKKENTNSSDCELFGKEYCEQSLVEKQDCLEEPISTKHLNNIEVPKSSTSHWFELLAKKINESNLTAEQKDDIESALASDNTLPALLCQSCLYRLLDAYNLQQLAAASERRLREYFGLQTTSSSCGGSSVLSCSDLVNTNTLPNTELMKADTDCSSASMYANIYDMFDRHDITNDMVEVVGTDDVELLNDVEIDVSGLTRSEAEETLSDVFMKKTRLTIGSSQQLNTNVEILKQQQNSLTVKQLKADKSAKTIKKSKQILKECLKKSLKPSDKCLECGKVFHYKGYLKIHKRLHTGDKPFKCQICTREFLTSNKLLLHQRTHNNINNNIDESLAISSSSSFLSTVLSESKRFQCEICSALFTTSSNLKSHKFTHSSKREYQCSICLAAFKSPRDLKRHQSIHETVEDIHCAICKKSFTKRASLNAHMITVHSRVRKHKCSDCDKIFGKRSNLINHMRIHSGEKPFKCSFCSWKFSQSSALKRHMKKHEKNSLKF